MSERYDGIVSCGSSVAPLNRLLAWENRSKSVVVMDPVLPPARAFDLAIVPRHDRPQGRNVFVTEGALHRIDPEVLEQAGRRLRERIGSSSKHKLGLLIGGDTDGYTLTPSLMKEVVEQMNRAAAFLGAELLVTTSRRTPAAVEKLLQETWEKDPRCRLLVIANQSNPEGTVQGILGLSSCVVVTGESISMVSEAASSGRYVFVFFPDRQGKRSTKIERTVQSLAREGYVTLCSPQTLSDRMLAVWERQPPLKVLKESARLKAALGQLL
jgi:mitochondrial fission protein ELM1